MIEVFCSWVSASALVGTCILHFATDITIPCVSNTKLKVHLPFITGFLALCVCVRACVYACICFNTGTFLCTNDHNPRGLCTPHIVSLFCPCLLSVWPLWHLGWQSLTCITLYQSSLFFNSLLLGFFLFIRCHLSHQLLLISQIK